MWTALLALALGAETTCDGVDDDGNGLIDDGALCGSCAQASSPTGNSLLFCGVEEPRDDAAARCSGFGYHLLDIDSSTEQAFVVGARPPTGSYWLGLELVGGSWVDSGGSPVGFFAWDTGYIVAQPEGNGQDCGFLWESPAAPGGWHDEACTQSYRAACEADCSPVTWYVDDDGDGFGTGSPQTGCDLPSNGALVDGDCDDGRSSTFPGASEICNQRDDDCDGAIDETTPDGDGDGLTVCEGDCNDADPTVYAGAPETCDGRDEDCDGFVDEDFDADGDGVTTCAGDCDDVDASVFPGAAEDPGGADRDCDGDTTDGPSYYVDADGDGFGDPATESSGPFPGAVSMGGDCDDQSSTRHPGALETCNGVDDDCSGVADQGAVCGASCAVFDTPVGRRMRCSESRRFASAVTACAAKGWRIATPTSAAENDALLQIIGAEPQREWWQGAVDIAIEGDFTAIDGGPVSVPFTPGQPNDDDRGQDCVLYDFRDGTWEVHDRACHGSEAYLCEPCPETAWFLDVDGDGVGAGDAVYACERPGPEHVRVTGDCDDADPRVRTGMAEHCDGIDNDCDGMVDEGPALAGAVDDDGDGFAGPGAVLVPSCTSVGAPPGDCDDGDPSRSPGAAELCNGVDDDCDGFVDEEGCPCEVVQRDAWVHHFCAEQFEDWTTASADCEGRGTHLAVLAEPEKHRHVGLTAFGVDNGDWWIGLYDIHSTPTWVDGTPYSYERYDNGNPSGNGECGQLWGTGSVPRWNDYPCDSNVDNWVCEAACTATTVYRDLDGDGDGDPAVSQVLCGEAIGWVSRATDCDDADPLIAGSLEEICDGLDNDCDGSVDEGVSATLWYADVDEDGFGDDLAETLACQQPPGTVAIGGDCDDTDPAVSPQGVEFCDGRDEDCNGVVDDAALDATPGFVDGDGDGYGPDSSANQWCAGSEPSGFVTEGGDCDDADPQVSPGGDEVCGGGDEDCDGLVDDADPTVDPGTMTTWYADGDGDGFGSPTASTVEACAQPSGFVGDATDCDDADPDTYPGGLDIPDDGIDQNCDGADTAVDADSDGDGLLDIDEITWGSDPYSADTDGDGIPDADELGIDPPRDTDGDGIPDHSDPDDDGDGLDTIDELREDSDGDGLVDYLDPDSDDDGVVDGREGDGDADGDGIPDRIDAVDDTRFTPPTPTRGCGCVGSGEARWSPWSWWTRR